MTVSTGFWFYIGSRNTTEFARGGSHSKKRQNLTILGQFSIIVLLTVDYVFMSTLNISMPDSMREYVEAQAEQGQYSASEFVRHLIREDQKRRVEAERHVLAEYLALSARQLDEGMLAEVTVEGLLAKGRARRMEAPQ